MVASLCLPLQQPLTPHPPHTLPPQLPHITLHPRPQPSHKPISLAFPRHPRPQPPPFKPSFSPITLHPRPCFPPSNSTFSLSHHLLQSPASPSPFILGRSHPTSPSAWLSLITLVRSLPLSNLRFPPSPATRLAAWVLNQKINKK